MKLNIIKSTSWTSGHMFALFFYFTYCLCDRFTTLHSSVLETKCCCSKFIFQIQCFEKLDIILLFCYCLKQITDSKYVLLHLSIEEGYKCFLNYNKQVRWKLLLSAFGNTRKIIRSDKLPAFTKQIIFVCKIQNNGYYKYMDYQILDLWSAIVAVSMRISAMNVLINLPAFYRRELEFSQIFWGEKRVRFMHHCVQQTHNHGKHQLYRCFNVIFKGNVYKVNIIFQQISLYLRKKKILQSVTYVFLILNLCIHHLINRDFI